MHRHRLEHQTASGRWRAASGSPAGAAPVSFTEGPDCPCVSLWYATPPRAARGSLARTARSSKAQSTPARPDTRRPLPNLDLPSSFPFNYRHSRRENPTFHRAIALDYGTRGGNLDGANQCLNQCAIVRYRRDVDATANLRLALFNKRLKSSLLSRVAVLISTASQSAISTVLSVRIAQSCALSCREACSASTTGPRLKPDELNDIG
jgi:hypothetical protein